MSTWIAPVARSLAMYRDPLTDPIIRVGLNNAATSRILVNPAVIPILQTTANLYFYLF